jgi:hypothetical protein
MKTLSESTIQQQIISLLTTLRARHNFVFFSVPNEGIMMARGGQKMFGIIAHFKKMGLLPGTSDIIILCSGKAYCMEVKLPKYRGTPKHGQSDDQIRFQANVNRTGIPYEIVYDMNDVLPVLKGWRVVK